MEIKPLLELNTNKFYHIIVILAVMFVGQRLSAQFLGQDSDGNSTIILPSTSINIDGKNNIINLSFYRVIRDKNNQSIEIDLKDRVGYCFRKKDTTYNAIYNCVNEKWNIDEDRYMKSNWLYGLELKGTSKNGLSLVLGDGLLANSTNINFSIGKIYRNKRYNRKIGYSYVSTNIKLDSADVIKDSLEGSLISSINGLEQMQVITKLKANELKKFLKIKKLKDKIEKLKTDSLSLNDFEKTTRSKERLDDLSDQVNTLKNTLKIVNSVVNKYSGDITDLKDPGSKIKELIKFKKTKESIDKDISSLKRIMSKTEFPLLKGEINIKDYLDFASWKKIESKLQKQIAKYMVRENVEGKKFTNVLKVLTKILKDVKSLNEEVSSSFPKIEKLQNSDDEFIEILRKKNEIEIELSKLRKKPVKNTWEPFNFKLDINNYTILKTWKDASSKLKKHIGLLSVRKRFLEVEIENYREYLNEDFKDLYKDLIENLEFLMKKEKKKKLIDQKQVDFNKHIFYVRGGFSGKSFLFDLDNGANTADDRIQSRSFQGNKVEIGWTHHFKTNNFIGMNFSRSYDDNSENLSSSTYQFTVIDNTVVPNLQSSSSIEALSGPYDRFGRYQISADYVRLISMKNNRNEDDIKKDPSIYLSLNPYFRHNFYSDSETLKPNTSFGLGIYTFNVNNNSIAGGIFIQADDVFNVNREDAIPFSEQITIGLVFKYALTSFNPK